MAGAFSRLRDALADRYQIDREVGSGGMATVHLATDVRHQRRVALKVLRPELSMNEGRPKAGADFLDQLETAAPRRADELDRQRIFDALFWEGDRAVAEAASRRLATLPSPDADDLYATSFLRSEARAASAAGRAGDARRAYELYLRMRGHPEPALEPAVDSMRAELEAVASGG